MQRKARWEESVSESDTSWVKGQDGAKGAPAEEDLLAGNASEKLAKQPAALASDMTRTAS